MSKILPPLPPREIVVPKGWMERKVSRFDEFLLRAALHPKPWWKTVLYKLVQGLAKITLKFGYTFPYFLRPWRWTSILISKIIQHKRLKDPHETPKRLFLERMFRVHPIRSVKFNTFFAALNWVFVWFCISISPVLLEGVYVYTTFETYKDVIVTGHYRNITEHNTFAVHGYQLEADGSKRELYFEIGPNVWYWDLFPEFVFGQISDYDRCTFETYGKLIRIPTRLRIFSKDGIYALNPWIVKENCVTPNILPK